MSKAPIAPFPRLTILQSELKVKSDAWPKAELKERVSLRTQ